MGLFLLRFLLCGQLHDEVVQRLGQAFLVVVGLLGGYVDGLQSGAIVEGFIVMTSVSRRRTAHSMAGAKRTSSAKDWVPTTRTASGYACAVWKSVPV